MKSFSDIAKKKADKVTKFGKKSFKEVIPSSTRSGKAASGGTVSPDPDEILNDVAIPVV